MVGTLESSATWPSNFGELSGSGLRARPNLSRLRSEPGLLNPSWRLARSCWLCTYRAAGRGFDGPFCVVLSAYCFFGNAGHRSHMGWRYQQTRSTTRLRSGSEAERSEPRESLDAVCDGAHIVERRCRQNSAHLCNRGVQQGSEPNYTVLSPSCPP